MKAIKGARRLIASDPRHPSAKLLASLVLALETERSFELASLYTLDAEHFEMALELLRDWRLERYYVGKARLFDLSWQVGQLGEPPEDPTKN